MYIGSQYCKHFYGPTPAKYNVSTLTPVGTLLVAV